MADIWVKIEVDFDGFKFASNPIVHVEASDDWPKDRATNQMVVDLVRKALRDWYRETRDAGRTL